MASPCVSQAAYHSATTASVVWLLALDFIFTRCVSPCPQNFNIGFMFVFCPLWVPLIYRGSRLPPLFCCPLWFFGVFSVLLCVSFWSLWGPCSVLSWDLIGDLGLASSHGLDRTAANYTGADQLSSLPCRPGRPRAAKSAHMVRSVGLACIAKTTLVTVPYISACCCDLLLTAWTV